MVFQIMLEGDSVMSMSWLERVCICADGIGSVAGRAVFVMCVAALRCIIDCFFGMRTEDSYEYSHQCCMI